MRSPIQVTPNVAPLIDVMLVLLIIFMIVAPALLDGAPIDPPRAAHLRDHPDQPNDITLGVDAAGHYYLDKQPIDASSLAQRLRALYSKGRPHGILYLKADRALNYGKLLAVVDTARNSGVRVISMVSERETPAAVRP